MFKADRTITLNDIIPNGKQKSGVCPICHEYYPQLTEHHIKKKMLWGITGNTKYIVYVCNYCHMEVEREITRRENIILRERFETIYEDVILSFVEGSIAVEHIKRGMYHR